MYLGFKIGLLLWEALPNYPQLHSYNYSYNSYREYMCVYVSVRPNL